MKRQRRLVLISLAALMLTGLVLAHVEVLQRLLKRLFHKGVNAVTGARENAVAPSPCGTRREVLYGIFSTPGRAQTWAVVRRQAQCDLNNHIHSTVFVVGAPQSEGDREIVAREANAHGDVFVLSCEENMNEGKSYTYFKEALERFPCFNFYAKVDDDTAFAPSRLSARISAVPNEGPLFIGRSSEILDNFFQRYIVKAILTLRDMSWMHNLENYTAGMLYVLNAQAVREWVALNPTQLYGDEDFRTTYYMQQIGSRVVNLDTAFHDYIKYQTFPHQSHWRLDITHGSLAVHKCKSQRDLADAFASICVV